MSREIVNVGAGTNILGLFAKALVPKSKSIPKDSLPEKIIRQDVFVYDDALIGKYKKLCGFEPSHKHFALAYVTTMSFPLQLQLLVDKAFPHAVLGIIHLKNTVEQFRSFVLEDIARVEVSFNPSKDHSLGTVYVVKTQVFDKNEELLCQVLADNLKIHKKRENKRNSSPRYDALFGEETLWELPSNLGRSYASISKDINPIHLFGFSAKLFGFKRQITHGMYAYNRAFANLEASVNPLSAFVFSIDFLKPLYLPGKANFVKKKQEDKVIFEVQSTDKTVLHFSGYLLSKA
ncbi:MAG: hypothetical protein C4K58_05280 [Flavobacteriaceae bacterium]|nr:MAG: hypothetical protein C4K58_05280 [Flavobacteriaceae bacterium]